MLFETDIYMGELQNKSCGFSLHACSTSNIANVIGSRLSFEVAFVDAPNSVLWETEQIYMHAQRHVIVQNDDDLHDVSARRTIA